MAEQMDQMSLAEQMDQMSKMDMPPLPNVAEIVIGRVQEAGDDMYKVLGIYDKEHSEVTPDDVENAFRKMAPEVHQKKADYAEGRQAFSTLLKAYCFLHDPENKQKYDASGVSSMDKDQLTAADVSAVMDVLQHGQSLKNLNPVHQKILEAGNDYYALLSGGKHNRKTGLSLTYDELLNLFQEVEHRLEIDPNNIAISSTCMNRLLLAWSVLGTESARREYDSKEILDDADIADQNVDANAIMQTLLSRSVAGVGYYQEADQEVDRDRMPSVEEFFGIGEYEGRGMFDEKPSGPPVPWYEDWRTFMWLMLAGIMVLLWVESGKLKPADMHDTQLSRNEL